MQSGEYIPMHKGAIICFEWDNCICSYRDVNLIKLYCRDLNQHSKQANKWFMLAEWSILYAVVFSALLNNAWLTAPKGLWESRSWGVYVWEESRNWPPWRGSTRLEPLTDAWRKASARNWPYWVYINILTCNFTFNFSMWGESVRVAYGNALCQTLLRMFLERMNLIWIRRSPVTL
jgi:hypothetical protein